MSYDPTTDFLALLRQTSAGVRTERMPGLDYVIAAMVRAGIFAVQVGQTAPAINQSLTVWFKPAPAGSWTAEGTVFLYNIATAEYEPANPVLWSSLLLASAIPPAQVQDITTVGPVLILAGTGVVRVQNVGAPVVLTMPLSANKIGSVLISDWLNAAGTNNITVNLSGADKFPGGLASWTIAADAASIFLRPVPGGYAL
jgi:hypothetical protein